MFLRKLGPQGPHPECVVLSDCPDILELEDGDFAIIGQPITAEAVPHLPPGVGCGSQEVIVRIPRKVLVDAKRDIPDAV